MPNKSSSNSFLAGAAIYVITNIANAIVPFALLPILTRHLSTTEYGQIAMYQVLLTALGGILGLSVHGAAQIKYYDDDISHFELGAFIGSCFQILLATSILALLIALTFSGPLALWLGLKPAWIVWGVFASAAGFIQQIRLTQWQVRKKAISYALFRIGMTVANAGLSLWLVVGLGQGAAGRIDGQNWVLVLFAIFAFVLLRRDSLIQFTWNHGYVREALRFGVPLIPHVLGLFLLGTVDRILIKKELGLSQAGIYMVAVQLTLVMPIIFSAINNAYVPWLFERLKRNDEIEKKQIVSLTYFYFIVVLLSSGLAFLIGPWAVTFIAGARYADAGAAVGWLMLGQAFGGMYLMVTNYIFFSKKTGLLSIVTICSGLFNVLLMIILIKRFGIEGASIAFAIAMSIRFILTWWVAHKRHPMPWLHPF